MIRIGFLAGLAVPMVAVACARQPEPEPVVATMTPAEQACAAQAGIAAGVDASVVTVAPVSSTKTGATVYSASAGEAAYTCVVEPDLTISSFAPA